MYQQSPFEDDVWNATRNDCGIWWSDISNATSFKGKSVLDFGCAEGYFGFKAILSGAKFCDFVDENEGCLEVIKKSASAHAIENYTVSRTFNEFGFWDTIIFLDLIYHGSKLPSLASFATRCTELIISPSGSGTANSPRLREDLAEFFKNIQPIHEGYENRVVFRCTR